MAPGRLLRCLVATLTVVCAASACKGDKAGDAPKVAASAADLDKQCARVGAACGDKDKHMQTITDDCKQAAKAYTDGG